MFMDIVRDSEMKVKVDTAGCLWACSVTGRLMKLRIDRCGFLWTFSGPGGEMKL
jgi:hypothetical protein